jgi:hypothetical protein
MSDTSRKLAEKEVAPEVGTFACKLNKEEWGGFTETNETASWRTPPDFQTEIWWIETQTYADAHIYVNKSRRGTELSHQEVMSRFGFFKNT